MVQEALNLLRDYIYLGYFHGHVSAGFDDDAIISWTDGSMVEHTPPKGKVAGSSPASFERFWF